MICEAIVDEVLGGPDKILLHFDISWQYLFGFMYRLE